MNRWDLLVVVGVLAIAIGAGLIYPPAGLIVFGAGLVGIGVVGATVDARSRRGNP
jgi:hypothetical protein